MTKRDFRNILWAIAGAFAIYCLLVGAHHHLATASIIFALGAVQEEDE